MGEQTGGMRFDKHECPFLFYRVHAQSQDNGGKGAESWVGVRRAGVKFGFPNTL
jgi:hypothetical protein